MKNIIRSPYELVVNKKSTISQHFDKDLDSDACLS